MANSNPYFPGTNNDHKMSLLRLACWQLKWQLLAINSQYLLALALQLEAQTK